LKAEYDAAVKAHSEQVKKEIEAQTQPQPVAVGQRPRPDRDFYPRFKAYAEKHAGQPEALPALAWLLDNDGWMTEPDRRRSELKWIADRLRTDHAADPNIKEAVQSLAWNSNPEVRDFTDPLYERIIKDNPDVEVKAAATLAMARTDYVTRISNGKSEVVGDVKRARERFGQVVRDYPGTAAAGRAEGYLFELDHLQVGMRAPDFSGTDVAGKEIKLSDFRGRVVVVSFWGFW
jgi:hypothetical protein